MTTFNANKDEHTFFGRMVFNLVGSLPPARVREVIDRTKDGEATVKVTVNGIEIDARTAFADLERGLDEMVRNAAVELLNELFHGRIVPMFEDFQRSLAVRLEQLQKGTFRG